MSDYVLLSNGTKGRFACLDDIRLFSIEGNYITVELADGQKTVIRGSLRKLKRKLNGGSFLPVHRACIVNLARVRETLIFDKRMELTLDDGQKLTASRLCTQLFKNQAL